MGSLFIASLLAIIATVFFFFIWCLLLKKPHGLDFIQAVLFLGTFFSCEAFVRGVRRKNMSMFEAQSISHPLFFMLTKN